MSIRVLAIAMTIAGVAACKSTSATIASTSSSPRPVGLCRGLDTDGRELRDALVRILTSNDSGPVRTRATLHLSALPADSVVMVQDAALCERAAATVTRSRGVPGRGYETLNVFRVGPLYIVSRPDGHAGILAMVMDQNFKILQGLIL